MTPVIVLSARTDEEEKIAVLDSGANDYITKPFGSGELLARVRAALRNNRFSADEGRLPGGKFILKDLEIDLEDIVYSGVAAAAAAKLVQLCPTLCNPIDSSPLGSPIPGILQARTLEWVAISFSNA